MSAQTAQTALNRLLGVEHALIQAPMAGHQGHALAAAVSNAGALGSLPSATFSPQALAAELQALRAQTERPFNLNFFCHPTPQADAAREQRWRQRLSPYADEFGIDLGAVAASPGRAPFSAALADLVEPFLPPVVSFHFGLPEPALLQRVKAWGAVVLSSATTLDEGRWLQAHGADAVIAQGLEAGGHRGHFLGGDLDVAAQSGTLTLVAGLLRVLHVPVIAAGGIADARAVAAMRALGAAGVQIGTAYLLCPEAQTSAVHRAALKSPQAQRTALTNLFTGRPARGIVNRLMHEQGPMQPDAPAFPLAGAALAPLRAAAEAVGRSDFSPLWAGADAGGCREIGAAELTRALAAGWV